MEPPPVGLEAARIEIAAAAARLRRLKHELFQPAQPPARLERWRALRRTIEGLRDALSGWAEAGAAEPSHASPDSRRRRRELEARALRAESALSEVEARHQRLDEEHARVLAEIERVHEGWRLLRQDLEPSGLAADAGALSSILGRLQALIVSGEHALAEERQAQREARACDQAWRWIVGVGFPTFEQRLRDCDNTATLPTMRRLVSDLDRRWRLARREQAALAGQTAAVDAADQKRRDEQERLRQEDSAAAEALRAERDRALAFMKETLAAQAETHRLETESQSRQAEAARADAQTWKRLSEAARVDLDRLLARLELEAGRSSGLEQELERLRQEHGAALEGRSLLERELKGLRDRLAAMARQPPPAEEPPPPPLLAGPEPAWIASIEPALEPGWQRIIERLREPIATAYDYLRRLYAAPLSDGHRALVRLSAAALAQAGDTIRIVREYLDEGAAPQKPGRVDIAVEKAVAAWEPALARRGIRLSRSVAPGLPLVRAGTEPLRVAIYHLLRNAWEAMPKGGILTIGALHDEATGETRVCITDTGPGLPADSEALFAPFASSKPGHLGLGLALARRIARRAGGDLEAGGKPGKGAKMTLRLPPHDSVPPALAPGL